MLIIPISFPTPNESLTILVNHIKPFNRSDFQVSLFKFKSRFPSLSLTDHNFYDKCGYIGAKYKTIIVSDILWVTYGQCMANISMDIALLEMILNFGFVGFI